VYPVSPSVEYGDKFGVQTNKFTQITGDYFNMQNKPHLTPGQCSGENHCIAAACGGRIMSKQTQRLGQGLRH